jgi:hypothetical protein
MTDRQHMTTCTYGFNVKCFNNITKGQFINICRSISAHFSYDQPIDMVPEPITEGGILFKGGGYGHMYTTGMWYKTMRIRMENVRWPMIDETTINEWTDNNEILYPAGTKGTTFLKAFSYAPGWTFGELTIFRSVFEAYGIQVTKMPKKSALH